MAAAAGGLAVGGRSAGVAAHRADCELRLGGMNGKWSLGPEKPVYESDWMSVAVAKATLPDATEIDHHVVRCGKGGANVLCYKPDEGILMIWRHRPLFDEWAWELPGGRVEDGEKAAEAAVRELREETGWTVDSVTEMVAYQPLNAFIDHELHCFFATEATWVGPEPDANEVAELAWLPLSMVRELLEKKEIRNGFSLNALLYAFSFGPLKDAK